jgi:uncharacterized protein YcaQ
MDTIKVSKQQARKFLLARSLLRFESARRAKPVEYEHIAPLECIQLDALRIVERNQDLVLHNRFDNYKPHMLGDIAYEKRRMIEAFFNAFCFVPIEEYRFHRVKHRQLIKRFGKWPDQFKKEFRLIKSEIKKLGTLPASYFQTDEKIEHGFGGTVKKTTAAIDILWYSGELVTDRRENGKRFYNLPREVLPESVNLNTPTQKQFEDFMLRKHFRTYHIGDIRYFRFANMRLKIAERKKLIEPYLIRGEIIPVEIENIRNRFFIINDSLDELINSQAVKADGRARFMAPLDNLLFNRDMIEDIFDFEYRWEVYAPKAKRKYGYYVMPILYNFDFIGRIDPKADRENSTLIFNLIQIEDNVKLTDKLISEIAKAAKRLAGFAELKNIAILKTSPASLKKRIENIL